MKFDLHIHSPGSNDYTKSQALTVDQQYISILEEAQNKDIEIIAITDHNTFRGYNKLKEIINNNYQETKSYKKLLIYVA